MLQFNDLIRMQKRLPPECPLHVTPFINDPLAFVGQPDLDADAQALKSFLRNTSAGDPVLPAALEGIDESLGVIRKAERVLADIRTHAAEVFPGYECTATGSLYQSDSDLSHTLWLEAFKEGPGCDLMLQMHSTLDLRATWAQIVVFAKNEAAAASADAAMQPHAGSGWEFKRQKGPELEALILEKRILGKDLARTAMEDSKRVLDALENALKG